MWILVVQIHTFNTNMYIQGGGGGGLIEIFENTFRKSYICHTSP